MKSDRDIAYEVILRALADCRLTPDDADMCLADVGRDYRVICEAWETMRRQVPDEADAA